MNYKVEAIPNFKKEAKKLLKKFCSLKHELKAFFKHCKASLTQAHLLEAIVIKYG